MLITQTLARFRSPANGDSAAGRPDASALQPLFEHAANAVLITDSAGRVTYMNPVAETLTGQTLGEALGMPAGRLLKFAALDTGKRGEIPVAQVIAECRAITLPRYAVVTSAAGRIAAVRGSVSPIVSAAAGVEGALIQLFEVNDDEPLPDTLLDPDRFDQHTGLLRPAELEVRITRALASVAKRRAAYVLAFLHVDGLRSMAVALGQPFCDDVVKAVASMIRGRLRDRDSLARLEDDRFAILLEGCTIDDAPAIASQMLAAVGRLRFQAGGQSAQVTISIGLADLGVEVSEAGTGMRRAAAACEQARKAGGNRVMVMGDDEAMAAAAIESCTGGAAACEITAAIQAGRLDLALQPIVSLRTSGAALDFFEVFTRLRLADGDQVQPAQFLPEVKRNRQAALLDRAIIRRAFAEYVRVAPRRRKKAPMLWAINLSVETIEQDDFLAYVQEEVQRAGATPDSFCFEISESVAFKNLKRSTDLVRSLKQLGFRVSMDNFGPALGSFASLPGLRLDFLKIDGAYIKNVTRDQLSRRMVKSMHYLCSTLGVKTVAEKVEDPDMVATLNEIGLDYAQGFEMGRPAPLDLVMAR